MLVLSTIIALAIPSPGSAHHAKYCGHGTRIYNDGQDKSVYVRWLQDGADHFHKYRHDRMTPNGWVTLHRYWKLCNNPV